MSPRVDISMSEQEVVRFLDERPRVATLSTLDRDGAPHSAAMWFVRTGRELRMWTYAKSQKGRNLQRDPRCALLIEEGLAYDELRGVLVRGRVEIESRIEQVVAIGVALYARYLPRSGGGIEQLRGEIERQAPKRIGLVLPLTEIASWDHRKLGTR